MLRPPGACALKFDQCPLPMANPRTTKTAMAVNLVHVETFWRSAPQRSPTTLTQVRMALSSNQVAVSFAEVNVLSARVGKHGAEFGERDAGAQRNHAAEDPHQKKQRWIRQRPGNIFGGKKN